MKILLINPPPRKKAPEDVVVPPLGIAYIAAVLENEGFQVDILDAYALQLTWNEFENIIKRKRPNVVGITGMTPVIDRSFKAADICKKYVDYVILGGPHVSAQVESALTQCSNIDFAVYWEGEITFSELVRKLEEGNTCNFGDINGIMYKDNGKIHVTKPRELIPNLGILPFPARHLLPNKMYKYPLAWHRRITTMFTSRGCPYGCIFCDKSIFGKKYRERSATNVVDEMEEIVTEFKIKSIIIYDDLFTLNKNRVIEICKGIVDRGLDIDWKCEGRVNLVDKEMLKWMKKAGCTLIAYGVESGTQKCLDFLNKKTTVQQAKDAFKATKEVGIKTLAYIILGIPVETWEDACRSIELVKEIDADYVQFSTLSPFPGTKFWDMSIEKGWYVEVNGVQNPHDADLKRPAAISENWDEQKLQDIIKLAHKEFYLRKRYMIKRLLSVRSYNELRFLFREGGALFSYVLQR